MTCIVAARCTDYVMMGCDSLGSSGWDCEVRKDPKMGKVGDYLLGYSGSYRLGQVLLYDFDPPAIESRDGHKLYSFIVSKFIPKLRDTLVGAGAIKETNKIQELDGASFIIGIGSHIFVVGLDFQVAWPSLPYAAIGCGAPYAIGAMYLGHKSRFSGQALLQSGLEAATKFSNGVRGPFLFKHT